MRVAIRVDSSRRMGTGHASRCRSLATALEALGANVVFVTRALDEVASAVFASMPHEVRWIQSPAGGPQPNSRASQQESWIDVPWDIDAADTALALADFAPDWLCVDHYALDSKWHDRVRERLGCGILAIDDLGDRPISADVLLDANVSHDQHAKYRAMVRTSVRTLFGPSYALLGSAYRDQLPYAFHERVRSIGIFMGGTDPHGVSEMVVRECRAAARFDGPLEVVSTSTNPHLESLRRACARDSNTRLTLDLPDLTAFYVRHDLQIGAGGTSCYERSCLGVPTIAVVLAENQLATVPILHDLEVVRGASIPGLEITRELANFPPLAAVLDQLADDDHARRKLADNARQLVDGRGAERVALKLLSDSLRLRSATTDDAAMIHTWRNHPATRAVSVRSDEIAFADHERWLKGVLASPEQHLFIAIIGSHPVGVIRFDKVDDCAWEVSLYTDPGLQGLGIGKRMLAAGEEAIATLIGSPPEILAEVVPGNAASLSMFERAGYSGGATRLSKKPRRGAQP